ncbi:MAG: bifunctional phosphopantothenoylcysteine decarboxylase/phosphopantothenate--cysteine ligase CoaBC [Candidatus Diapherotrites archaeon]|uniref:Coenzyme A biosynthesis bifunctional protein CoaBC n=1 Tax=Candidatus Iainarchaeum sp. TaxID=3101447 RepID=A0A2D6M0E5_9ARCH|nr:bifunctional phosphopantothenoylcysteine decarboxylase/phosphopantothenate--cysteine ligase CoaBC [Candidatus Diapherotrites archaeon]
MNLRGKKIVVCVTGSVAAIETPKLVRELRRLGADIFCVISKSAKGIIHQDVLEWASNNKVVTRITGNVEHVKLAGNVPEKADLIIVAPATANTIGKIANAIDDTAVTTFVTTALGTGIPLIIVPAMHGSMYKHPIVKENIAKLKRINVSFMQPRVEEGKAKFPPVKSVVETISNSLAEKDLAGKTILVTAGPTVEAIDSLRYLTNKSSGKTGVWIADAAVVRGAKVILIRGPTKVEPTQQMRDIKVNSAKEMFTAVKKNSKAGIMIHTAAVADYTLKEKQGKIESGKSFSLKLTPTAKILDQVKKWNKKIFLVGFKAEYGVPEKQLVESAFKKLKESKADLIVANDLKKKTGGIGHNSNEVYVVDRAKKVRHFGLMHKKDIANKILALVK